MAPEVNSFLQELLSVEDLARQVGTFGREADVQYPPVCLVIVLQTAGRWWFLWNAKETKPTNENVSERDNQENTKIKRKLRDLPLMVDILIRSSKMNKTSSFTLFYDLALQQQQQQQHYKFYWLILSSSKCYDFLSPYHLPPFKLALTSKSQKVTFLFSKE